MNFLYPIAIASTTLIANRIISNYRKTGDLRRVSLDWRNDDNITMVVQDGHERTYTVNQKGGYWYTTKDNIRVSSRMNKLLMDLKFSYLDDVKILLGN